jgi:hypothetical protein
VKEVDEFYLFKLVILLWITKVITHSRIRAIIMWIGIEIGWYYWWRIYRKRRKGNFRRWNSMRVWYITRRKRAIRIII